jgi:hypothetical protein
LRQYTFQRLSSDFCLENDAHPEIKHITNDGKEVKKPDRLDSSAVPPITKVPQKEPSFMASDKRLKNVCILYCNERCHHELENLCTVNSGGSSGCHFSLAWIEDTVREVVAIYFPKVKMVYGVDGNRHDTVHLSIVWFALYVDD